MISAVIDADPKPLSAAQTVKHTVGSPLSLSRCPVAAIAGLG